MFILSSISSGLEFWSIIYASIYENSESKVFKNIFSEICNNRPNELLGKSLIIVVKQYYNVLILLQ